MTPPARARDRRGVDDWLARATPDIEVRHLRSFVATAEELSFSRAARRLHLSQPALSRQIGTLERLLGCALLRRSTHHVEITLAGSAMLDHARSLLADLDRAVTDARSVGGELSERAARMWADTRCRARRDGTVDGLRRAFEELHADLNGPAPVPLVPVTAGGVPSLQVGTSTPGDRRVLFVHGGGHVSGSAYGYRGLAGALARATRCPVVVPDYRLAPENPRSAAVEDVVAVYRWLLTCGIDVEDVAIAGDTSGAELVLDVAARLREDGSPLPGHLVLLDPWLGAAQTPEWFGFQRRTTPGTGRLDGLPPTIVQIGAEALTDHRAATFRHLAAHAPDITIDVIPTDVDAFPLFWSFLPEAAEAVERVGRHLAEERSPGGMRPDGFGVVTG